MSAKGSTVNTVNVRMGREHILASVNKAGLGFTATVKLMNVLQLHVATVVLVSIFKMFMAMSVAVLMAPQVETVRLKPMNVPATLVVMELPAGITLTITPVIANQDLQVNTAKRTLTSVHPDLATMVVYARML